MSVQLEFKRLNSSTIQGKHDKSKTNVIECAFTHVYKSYNHACKNEILAMAKAYTLSNSGSSVKRA